MSDRLALYPRLCGAAWADLDEAVRRLHEAGGVARASGRFDLTTGRGLLRAIAWVLGLPRPGVGVPTSLEITPHEGGERWHRTFGDVPFVTEQLVASDGELLFERTRFMQLAFALRVAAGALHLVHVSTALRLGALVLRLPRWLAPRVNAREDPVTREPGRLRVEVAVSLPLIGQIFHYGGVIELGPAP